MVNVIICLLSCKHEETSWYFWDGKISFFHLCLLCLLHFQNVASRCINLGMLFLQGQYRVLFDIIHAYNEETWIPEGNGTEPLRQHSLQGSRIFSWLILCKSKFPENWIKLNKPLQKMSDISVCTEGSINKK